MDVDVIAAKLDALDRRSDERHQETKRRLSVQDSTLSRIEQQCNATNGRVSKLEQAKIWLPLLVGAVWTAIGAVWFVLTQVMGFQRVP